MHLASLLAAAAALTTVSASPTPNVYAVHERRNLHNDAWTKRYTVNPSSVVPMRIGLKQQNLDRAEELLTDVSHPESENYGKHWTPEQVLDFFRPSKESVSTVRSWLHESGIAADRVKATPGHSWLEFNATVQEIESLLKAKYHMFEHEGSGIPHLACDEYSLPMHVKDHVDLVLPSVHMDAKVRGKVVDEEAGAKEKRQVDGHQPVVGTGSSIGKSHRYTGPFKGDALPFGNNLVGELSMCDMYITPDCLRALYQFTPNVFANPKNSYGIVEYSPEAYIPSDLDMFFRNYSTRQVGSRPILESIDGGVNQQTTQGFAYNGEPDLDLEYAMALVYPQPVILYQVGDLVEGASFNNFLDGIDGSYCTYMGGDDPTQDATYPDPLPGGYQGPEDCGKYAPTKVISTSYAYNEADLTPFYEMRQCNEYMKLGLMGTSVLYSSGDYGVAGNGGQCISPVTGAYVPPNTPGSTFNPSFPGTCPYITSVGATQVKNGVNVVTAMATGTEPEMACETVIYSGGGFSNVFPLPAYQSAAVKSYFKNHLPPYTAVQYNNSMKTRGFPDISANGANYVVAIDGTFSLVYGTSASSPTSGSILTLINQARLDIGKSSIGFINPALYAHPYVLNDITQGGNMGCDTPGFSSVPGWDPVTGLGTPNYPKLLALFLSLP